MDYIIELSVEREQKLILIKSRLQAYNSKNELINDMVCRGIDDMFKYLRQQGLVPSLEETPLSYLKGDEDAKGT